MDLKLFDIVEHEDGTKKMVVSIEEKFELSDLSGCGDSVKGRLSYEELSNYPWSVGAIIKVWRPKDRGFFGFFLSKGFKTKYFNLVWEKETNKTTDLTLQEIANKFGVSKDKLRIKE